MRFAAFVCTAVAFLVGCTRPAAHALDGGVSGADLAPSPPSEAGDLALGAASDLARSSPSDLDSGRPLPALPLHTDGRFIVDANGKRFKLAAVNWYGAEEADHVVAGLDRQPLAAIARLIAASGFNAVRLPWSNELVENNPLVDDARLAANPELRGRHALDLLDAVIAALAHEGIVVVLDNHVSTAIWCCADGDVNALWHNADYPEASWLADWKTMAKRYASEPAVVAADLRNELRGTAAWGNGDAATDWRLAAKKGGEAVLSVNPKLLIMVEGLGFSLDFTSVTQSFGAQKDDVQTFFSVAHRLVWSPHDYGFDHKGIVSYDGAEPALKTQLGDKWGYLLVQNQAYSAPVWVGEFGTCNTGASCVDSTNGADLGFWFAGVRRYLADADIDWSYWAWNGTEANGGGASGRTVGSVETYGVLDPAWTAAALPALLAGLQAIAPATQGPK